MVISTGNVIAIRCSQCGSLDFHLLSLFSFGGTKKLIKIKCACGYPLITISTKDWKTFWLQPSCLMCEAKHVTYLSRRRIWSDDVEVLVCPETGVEMGAIGPKVKVQHYVQEQDKSLRQMAEDMGFGEYFDSPEIMYEVLDYLYEIAEDEKLYCECGNYQIDIDVFSDRLELKCSDCHCTATVYAESERDIKMIENSYEIKLTKNGFNFKKTGKLTKRNKNN